MEITQHSYKKLAEYEGGLPVYKEERRRKRRGAKRKNRIFVGTTAIGQVGWWLNDLTKWQVSASLLFSWVSLSYD
jgi:hypothetical protein